MVYLTYFTIQAAEKRNASMTEAFLFWLLLKPNTRLGYKIPSVFEREYDLKQVGPL